MKWQSWFSLRSFVSRRKPNRRRVFFEPLEERRVLASITLNGAGGGQAGALDAAFSGDGKAIAEIAGTQVARDMAIQTLGGVSKIIVVGSTDTDSFSDFAVARFNLDGTLDMSFGGGDGLFTHDFAGGNDDAHAVAIDGAGNIVVAGNARNMAGNDGDFDFAV